MTSERLGEMFKDDSTDTCAIKFPLVSMGGRADPSIPSQKDRLKHFVTDFKDTELKKKTNSLLPTGHANILMVFKRVFLLMWLYVTMRTQIIV